MSVTLFLVALVDILKQVQEPVEIVGYADDWAIYTSDQDMETAQTNTQSALNNLPKWTRRKGVTISLEKTIAMHICRKRNNDHPDPQLRLNGQILEVKNTQKILGITFDNRLTRKAHITEANAKAAKRMNILRSLAVTNWSADQGMLLRIHEMSMAAYRTGHRWIIETAGVNTQ
jgi:hypothetical protein